MAWEKRLSGGLYYTRSRRRRGRVRREYVGGGLLGQMAAELDTRRRAERKREKEEVEAQKQRLAEVDEKVAAFCGLCSLLSRAALLPEGYHYDAKNASWRKKRA
jgi:hypothetical protein